MSVSAPTWLLVAIPALLLALMLLVVVCALVLGGRADDRLESLPRYGAESPAGGDAMASWDAEAELAGLRWDWDR